VNPRYRNLTEAESFKALRRLPKPEPLRKSLTGEKVRTCVVGEGGGLSYNYAAKQVDEEVLNLLQRLADEQEAVAKYRELLDGGIMNTGEKRMVLHHLVRGQLGKDVISQG